MGGNTGQKVKKAFKTLKTINIKINYRVVIVKI